MVVQCVLTAYKEVSESGFKSPKGFLNYLESTSSSAMPIQAKHLYNFGPFRLDTAEQILLRNGAPVPLPYKVLETLVALVEKSGHVISKDELMQRVWPDTFVEEANLTVNISTLRKALGQGSNGHQYIETLPKHGYRFTSDVNELAAQVALYKILGDLQSNTSSLGEQITVTVLVVDGEYSPSCGLKIKGEEGIAEEGGVYPVRVGSFSRFEIENLSPHDLYITAIHEDRHGSLEVFFPPVGTTLMLPKGEKLKTEIMISPPPLGDDTFTIIASSMQVDLYDPPRSLSLLSFGELGSDQITIRTRPK